MEVSIIEALEATAIAKNRSLFDPVNATKRDIKNWRDTLMRFLEELDAEITVGEIRQALDDYS